MKITIKEIKLVDDKGNEETQVRFLDEDGNEAKGIYTVKDGRPFDLIMNEYAD